jgi:hypothetical protein
MNMDKQKLIERFEKQRTRWLQLSLVGFILGFGTSILRDSLL